MSVKDIAVSWAEFNELGRKVAGTPVGSAERRAYESAQRNADDTAKENEFGRYTEGWYESFFGSYACALEDARSDDVRAERLAAEDAGSDGGWTLAYRKRGSWRFKRLDDFSGTWAEAREACGLASELNEELEIWYLPTAAMEQLGKVHVDDVRNVLVDSGKRVVIYEGGKLLDLIPEEQAQVLGFRLAGADKRFMAVAE